MRACTCMHAYPLARTSAGERRSVDESSVVLVLSTDRGLQRGGGEAARLKASTCRGIIGSW